MSAPHRCPRCQHRPGSRGLDRVTLNLKTKQQNTKKAPCSCGCHVFGAPGLHLSTAPLTEAQLRQAYEFAAEHGFLVEA